MKIQIEVISVLVAILISIMSFPAGAHIAAHHELGISGWWHALTHIDHPAYWMGLVIFIVLAFVFSLFAENGK